MQQYKPAEIDFTVYQGVTFYRKVTLTDPSTGEPFDLTDDEGDLEWKSRMQVRESYDVDSYVIELTSDSGMTITATDTESSYTIEMTAEQTANFPTDNEYLLYDVELENLNTGQVIRMQKGKITVDPEVTK